MYSIECRMLAHKYLLHYILEILLHGGGSVVVVVMVVVVIVVVVTPIAIVVVVVFSPSKNMLISIILKNAVVAINYFFMKTKILRSPACGIQRSESYPS